MKIIVASPLYPPDVAMSAKYVKELVSRLGRRHDVTAVIYGHLPEKVDGVVILPVDKRRLLPIRLMCFFSVLRRAARDADILYIENGPSVELPAGFIALFSRKPFFIHIGDNDAHEYAKKHLLRRVIENFASHRAIKVIEESPMERPEVLPFEPFPQSAFNAYEESWKKHIANLENIFEHATT